MKYYTICYPDYNTLGQDYVHWETLSEKEILNDYWNYWSNKMAELDQHHLITKENCIDDWCVIHWAERNYWREMKDCIA
jgi:hypothetical protein